MSLCRATNANHYFEGCEHDKVAQCTTALRKMAADALGLTIKENFVMVDREIGESWVLATRCKKCGDCRFNYSGDPCPCVERDAAAERLNNIRAARWIRHYASKAIPDLKESLRYASQVVEAMSCEQADGLRNE